MPDSIDIHVDDDVAEWVRLNGTPEPSKSGVKAIVFTPEEDKVLLALWGGTTKRWLAAKLGHSEGTLRKRYRELIESRSPSPPSR